MRSWGLPPSPIKLALTFDLEAHCLMPSRTVIIHRMALTTNKAEPEGCAPSTMLDKFSWLHLSDFHFRSDGDLFSQEVSTRALLSDLPSRLSSEHPLQFVVVTGDIAFSGKPSQYDLAAEFFESLASTLGLGMDRIFVVPGNHDVDRSLQEYLYEGVLQKLTNQQAVDEFIGHESARTALLERQSAFRAFQEGLFVDGATTVTEDKLARVWALDLDGLRICVLELNSAWLSGSRDRAGRLLVGERQVINALALAERHQPHLTISLMHHPMEWLSEFDQLSCTGRLLPRLHISHSGHLHRHEVSVRLLPGTECLLVSAGSSHESRFYENSYNLVEFEVGSAECQVRKFEYLTETGVFKEVPASKCGIGLGHSPIAGSTQFAATLRELDPSIRPYADYLATLITGEMNEVPIKIDDGNCILASRDYPAELQFAEVSEFLRIPNMLRTYFDIPLSESLALHKDAILKLAGLISRIEAESPEFADMLSSHVVQAKKLTGVETKETSPYQIQHLDDLATSGEWQDLAEASRRYLTSMSEEVQIAARRRLSWALLRSDERTDRAEGLTRACDILREPWAGFQDYIVASVGAVSLDDNECAVTTAAIALENWPKEPELLAYCRTLAVRTGSQRLARLLS